MQPRVAILIPSFQGFLKLGKKLFESLDNALSLKYDNLDLVFVDNGSTDSSAEEVRGRYGNSVRVVRLERNYGYAGGLVRAVEVMSKTSPVFDYLAPLNNDYAICNPDVLSEIVRFMEREKNVSSAQALNLGIDGMTIHDAGMFLDIFLSQISRYAGHSVSEYPERTSYVSSNTGPFFVIKVESLKKANRFPRLFESKFFAVYEETELCLNMWSKGFASVTLPIEGGTHIWGATSNYPGYSEYVSTRNKMICAKGVLESNPLSLSRAVLLVRQIAFEPARNLRRPYVLRATVDGLTSGSTTNRLGPLFPFLFAPKRDLSFASNGMPFLGRSWFTRFSRVRDEFVSLNMLKESARPFLLTLQ